MTGCETQLVVANGDHEIAAAAAELLVAAESRRELVAQARFGRRAPRWRAYAKRLEAIYEERLEGTKVKGWSA